MNLRIAKRKSEGKRTSIANLSESPDENICEKRFLNSFSHYIDEGEDFHEDEIIPHKLEGIYKYDYNILSIDEIIRKKIEQDKRRKLKTSRVNLEIEKKKMEERQNMIERKRTLKRISEIEEEIKKYDDDLLKYDMKSKAYIEEYKKLGPIKVIVSFATKNHQELQEIESEETQQFRHKIISGYLECARKFIYINIVRQLPEIDACSGCGTKYAEINLIEENGAFGCPICGLEKVSIMKNPLFSDGCRINNSKNDYEDRANFIKVLMRYQGKQITKPEKNLYEKLDEYFLSKGLLSSEEYLKMPVLPDGTKEGTTKELMYEALSAIKCTGYFDDINLICNVFFGWLLPDISHLEDAIMKDYDTFQEAYNQIPDKEGRTSSLNSQWKLYILLKRRGWPCKSRDFKIPTTPDILEYHKLITKKVYEKLGWTL